MLIPNKENQMLKTMIDDPVQRKNLIKAAVAVGTAFAGLYALRKIVEKDAENEIARRVNKFPNRFTGME